MICCLIKYQKMLQCNRQKLCQTFLNIKSSRVDQRLPSHCATRVTHCSRCYKTAILFTLTLKKAPLHSVGLTSEKTCTEVGLGSPNSNPRAAEGTAAPTWQLLYPTANCHCKLGMVSDHLFVVF